MGLDTPMGPGAIRRQERRAQWPTVADLARRCRSALAATPAVVGDGLRLTYGQLISLGLSLTGDLQRAGLAPGDRVGYLADNSAAYLAAYLCVPAAGFILAPLNTRLAPPELRFILGDADCRVVVAGDGYLARANEAVAGLPVTVIPERAWANSPHGTLTRPSAADPAYLYYTSGTTGHPKGVILSHANVMSGAFSAALAVGLNRSAVWLHGGPLFHLADAWAVWGLSWLGGRQVAERFDAERAVHLIQAEAVTHTLLVPTGVDLLVAAARDKRVGLPSLQQLLFGGAAMPRAVFDVAADTLTCALVPTYGSTEAAGICTVLQSDLRLLPANSPVRARSVGSETPLVNLNLVRPGGDANEGQVAAGEVGEIVVESPSVMLGYLNNRRATTAIVRDHQLHTGDLAQRDEQGNLYIVDRLKDMIITGGENVYAREVEQVLERFPGVADVAVIGRSDPRWGETVCAVVAPAAGHEISLDELQHFARASLAGYKIPRLLELCDRLPYTSSGKIDKLSLRQQFHSQPDSNRDGTSGASPAQEG